MHINPAIKQFIYGEVLKYPHDSVKIPSERELCEMFGTSRPTVRKALAELIREGVLIIRHGNGTYTCPAAVGRRQQAQRQRTLGVVLGYGSSLMLDSYYWSALHAAQQAFGDGEWLHLPLLQLAGEGRTAVAEISQYQLDALLWLHPDERRADVIAALRQDGLPVCCIGRSPGGAPAAMIDYPATGRHLAQYFIDRRIHHPLLVADRTQPVHMAMVQAFQEELIAAGIVPDFRRILLDPDHLETALIQLQAEGVDFDGAFSFGFATWNFQQALVKVFGEEKFTAIEFVVVNTVRHSWPDCAYLDIDGVRLGKVAGEYLRCACRGESFDPARLIFPVQVISPQKQ